MSKYTLDKDAILRDGVQIATRDPGTGNIDYLPDMDRYRAPVSGWLKEQGLAKPPVTPPEVLARQAKPRVAGEVSQESETVAPFEVAPAVTDTANKAPSFVMDATPVPSAMETRLAQLEAENARLRAQQTVPAGASMPMPVSTVQNANLLETQRALAEQAVLNGYIAEGAPLMEAGVGDKTAAFVLWLCKNHPDAARVRYNNRRVMGGMLVEEIITQQSHN